MVGMTERPSVVGPSVVGMTERPSVVGMTERPSVVGPIVAGMTERWQANGCQFDSYLAPCNSQINLYGLWFVQFPASTSKVPCSVSLALQRRLGGAATWSRY